VQSPTDELKNKTHVLKLNARVKFPNFEMKIFNINNSEVNNSIIMLSSFILGSLITLVLIGDSLIRKSLRNNELKKKIISIEEKKIPDGDNL